MNYQPWSEEAEQSVLGSLLIDNGKLPDVIELITAEDFYHAWHKNIFRAMEILHSDNKPVDPTTIINQLGDLLDDSGGLAYLPELAHNTPSSRNILAYAAIVQDKRKERDVLSMASDMVSIIQESEFSSAENINNALSVVSHFDDKHENELTYGQMNQQFLTDIETRSKLGGALTGVSSGFYDIDERLNGFQKSDLMILAGRPGSGKSTLAFNIAKHVSKCDPVIIFSMEMSAQQIIEKNYSSEGILLTNIRNGDLNDSDWAALSGAALNAKDLKLTIDDRPALKPQQIRAKCLNLKRKYGHIGLVVVDYIQLMAVNKSESRVDQVTQITGALKALAKELDCPVLALSQLNRDLEKRNNKRPLLSDLRESGSIEQDGDIIMMIYREDYYAEQEGRTSENPCVAELNIAKFKGGKVGRVFLKTELQYSRFRDISKNYVHREPEEKTKFNY